MERLEKMIVEACRTAGGVVDQYTLPEDGFPQSMRDLSDRIRERTTEHERDMIRYLLSVHPE